ncbi:MAG TPA: PEGA domain-containing protein [Longimicrobium sp.]|jgi:hypothetical protein|uniref:PEGA domain-containing protein n=1 Tax=Longimicrobium sp. TaxID=2029185 RepID=UPI002ED8CED0
MRGKFVVAACLALSGCATIVHGSKQSVTVASTPAGAQVMIDNMNVGVTPMSAQLSRKQEHTVRITMAGYQPYDLKMQKTVDGWIAGNILFGGIPGLIVDAATGAMYKLTPDAVNAQLTQGTAMNTSGDRMVIMVSLSPELGLEKVGQMTPAADLVQN